MILVMFRSSATAEQRRAAITAVCGRVVGGWRIGDTNGYFVVEINTDGSANTLWKAIDRLAAQPGVESAEHARTLSASVGKRRRLTSA